jgi:hypothetical protein
MRPPESDSGWGIEQGGFALYERSSNRPLVRHVGLEQYRRRDVIAL